MKRLNVVGEFCTLLTCCLMCILAFGCGSSGGGTATQPPSAITSVTITPTSATVQPGASQTFNATVSGTGSFSNAVSWSVNGKAGGDSTVGLISASGVYTTPATIPNPTTVTATATSTQDSTRSGSSRVQIGPTAYDVTGIQISPASATVNTSSTSYFYANVQGSGAFSNAVTWSVNNVPGGNSTVGTITTGPAVPNGIVPATYLAPSTVPQGGTVTLTAASAIAPGVVASAQLAIVKSTQAPPTISQLSPLSADAGTTLQVTGTGFTGDGTFPVTVTYLFTAANGVTIPAPASVSNLTDTQVPVIVPLGAATGPVSVQVRFRQSAHRGNDR